MKRRDFLLVTAAAGAAASGALPRLALAQDAKRPAYIEPPALEKLVKDGKLPPIARRLPDTPARVALAGERRPGEYGGDLRILMARDRDTRLMVVYGYARLVGYDENLEFVPDLVEKFEVKEGRDFTFTLRKGHKWSDGRPFTTEDFKFFWEDVANNKKLLAGELHPALVVEGERPKVEFPNATTVRYSWSKPNPLFLAALAAPSPLYLYLPSRYLKRFHEKYVDAARLKQLNGDRKDGWVRRFNRAANVYRNNNPAAPTLDPWKIETEPPSERFVFERNPFFHRVDANGRQLPYIDRVLMLLAESKIIPAKAGAGEVDLQARYLRFDNITFLRRGAKQHGYDVRLWKTAAGAQAAIYPNLTFGQIDPATKAIVKEDLALRALFRDVRFRRALSLAVDRREINEVLYYGLAVPGANTVLPGSPLYKPEYREAWAKLDVAAANALLDQCGLAKRDRDGTRLLPDGRRAELIVEADSESSEATDLLNLIKDHWAKAGLRLFPKSNRRELIRRRAGAGMTQLVLITGIDFALVRPADSPEEFVPTREDQYQWPKWGRHHESAGAKGDAVDMPEGKALLEEYAAWKRTTDAAERAAIWGRILTLHAENVFSIGLVGGVPQPVLVGRRLRNVPKDGIYAWDPGAHFGRYRPDTFWLAPDDKRAGG
jgi:peptide/nickel transport system substrate-binding protein